MTNGRLRTMLGYGLGECANSLVMNGFFAFAMLYYTEALHLDPSLAGIAMSVSVFWEAITDPVMGHVSDHTRHRLGRRHPWMLVGGLLMAVCFYFIWAVPPSIRADAHRVFWYLIAVNLLLRTGLTMFFIPYVALGFEIGSDYEGRSKVQAVRQVFNMLANFGGPAMAWSIFFRDATAPDGTKILGTSQPANFAHMGAAFSLAIVVMVLAVLWLTRGWVEDSRHAPCESNAGGLRSFWLDLKAILLDPNPRWVFVFIFILCVGMVLVSSLQMYVYVYFMKFQPHEKSIAHGSTMIGMALGGAVSALASKQFDKKGAVMLGGILSIFCNAALGALFLTGAVSVGGLSALALFVLFHASYWLGNGILLPVSTAMVADVSAIHLARTGTKKDGSYAAVFSLCMRLAISFALMASGWTLSAIGFGAHTVAATPSARTVWNLGAAMFIGGLMVSIAALLAIRKYPLTRASLDFLPVHRGPAPGIQAANDD